MTLDQIKRMMDATGHIGGSLYLSGTQITTLPDGLTVGGSLDLRGTQITTLPDGLTVGGSLYLRGTQWSVMPEWVLRKFAAPWFADSLVVDDIGDAANWCDSGIREAMGQLGLADDADEYDRAEVHAALKVRREHIDESDKAAVALAILDRVEAMK